jgi:hypothetical protein
VNDAPAVFQCGDCLRDIVVAQPVPRSGEMPCPTEGCEGGIDFAHAYRHAAEMWDRSDIETVHELVMAASDARTGGYICEFEIHPNL